MRYFFFSSFTLSASWWKSQREASLASKETAKELDVNTHQLTLLYVLYNEKWKAFLSVHKRQGHKFNSQKPRAKPKNKVRPTKTAATAYQRKTASSISFYLFAFIIFFQPLSSIPFTFSLWPILSFSLYAERGHHQQQQIQLKEETWKLHASSHPIKTPKSPLSLINGPAGPKFM